MDNVIELNRAPKLHIGYKNQVETIMDEDKILTNLIES
jgi:hypothetical protein